MNWREKPLEGDTACSKMHHQLRQQRQAAAMEHHLHSGTWHPRLVPMRKKGRRVSPAQKEAGQSTILGSSVLLEGTGTE